MCNIWHQYRMHHFNMLDQFIPMVERTSTIYTNKIPFFPVQIIPVIIQILFTS